MIPVHCPKCGNRLNFGKNKGDWSVFLCSGCSCRFSVVNSDIEDQGPIRGMIEKIEPFNPSKRGPK